MRSSVQRERLVEAILPIQDVALIAVEAREAQQVSVALEDGARLLRGGERFVVAAEGDETLQRAVERARDVHLPSQPWNSATAAS